MSNHAVQEDVLFGNGDIARNLLDLSEVILGDFALVLRDAQAPAVVEGFNVRTGHRKDDVLNHDVTALLGPHEGIMKASLGGLEIHDLAFAYTARRGLAYAQNFDGPIGPGLANDETDL